MISANAQKSKIDRYGPLKVQRVGLSGIKLLSCKLHWSDSFKQEVEPRMAIKQLKHNRPSLETVFCLSSMGPCRNMVDSVGEDLPPL